MKIITSKQMWSGFLLTGILLSAAAFSNAQVAPGAAERTVQGSVKDPDNNTLPGVSILLKGTQQGTMTDVNGAFEINVPNEGAELVFSFVGYVPQTIAVGNNSTLSVTLRSDLTTLDEVVVIGYGTQSRRNVTGSVAKVSMEDTETLPNINVTQALRGRVAGVQFIDNGRPGQNGSILIRGPRSLSGGNSPLIVLDGIYFNGSLAELNPNDIESIEVLKDASAAAIYGSRAANGVILITSKMGKSEKPTLSLNSFYGMSDYSYQPKLLTPERYLQKVLDYRTAKGMEANPENIGDYLALTEQENYERGITLDPYDLVSQKAYLSSHDLNISGKTATMNYYLSASLSDEKGLIMNDNLKRNSFRANFETQVTDWLKFGMHSTYSRRDYSGREAGTAYSVTPYGTAFYPDGNPTQYLADGENGSPIRSAMLTTNEEIHNNIFSVFSLTLDPPFVKGLSYRLNFSPNYRWRHEYNFFNQDVHVDGNTTSASKFNRQDYDWALENILTYSKQLSEDHGLDVTLLYGRNHLGFESTEAEADQLSSAFLGWNSLQLGELLTNTSSAGASDGVSSMARLNYTFKDRYLLTLTTRRDGSSVFAANNKYAVFPSAAVAWVVSDESFMKDNAIVSFMKLRISYGAVGNQAIAPYQSLSLSGMNRYVFGEGGSSQVGVFPSTMSNQDLKWETTYNKNIALDFDLFRGRLGGTFEVYDMDTRDLLVERSLPIMTGYQQVWTNLGEVNNKGIELSLNSVNVSSKKFEWTTNLVLSSNKNRIVKLYGSDVNNDGKEDDDLGNRWFIGQPIDVAYDYEFDGIYQEGDDLPTGYSPGYVRLRDLNNDGTVNADNDRRIIGQTGQPKWRWGLTNTFRYGNLSLSVFVNAMQGWIGAIPELDSDYFLAGSGNYAAKPTNRLDAGWWTPENRSNTRPSLGYTNPLLHNYYVSRDFIRVQDISLSYDLDEKLIEGIGLSRIRVFLSGKNLLTFTDWLGMDPENGNGPKEAPMPRTIAGGVNIVF